MNHSNTGYHEDDNEDDNLYQISLIIAQQEELERIKVEKEEREALQNAIHASRQEEHQRNLREQDERMAMHLQFLEQEQDEDMNEAVALAASEWRHERLRDRNQGAWDCLICTYTNRPYAPKCQACSNSPSEGVLTYLPLPGLRFGLEIETIISMGVRDGFSYQTIADQLTRLGPPSVYFGGYTHQTTPYWKLVTDSSLKGSNGEQDLCFELVSPVLQGEKGIEELRAVMDNIRRLGIATNASCGFHVHVDASDESPIRSLKAMKRISQCFLALENAFDLLVSLSWERGGSVAQNRKANLNKYCLSNRISFGSMTNHQRWDRLERVQSRRELVQLMNPENDRYRKLNLTNLVKDNRPSTCEFRHHGGVADIQEAEAWLRLVLLFCQNASSGGDRYSACLLREGEGARDEVLRLFDLVECSGLEQFFFVDRRLFEGERLETSSWACDACRKRFRTSRSLSQHKTATGHR